MHSTPSRLSDRLTPGPESPEPTAVAYEKQEERKPDGLRVRTKAAGKSRRTEVILPIANLPLAGGK